MAGLLSTEGHRPVSHWGNIQQARSLSSFSTMASQHGLEECFTKVTRLHSPFLEVGLTG